MSTCPRCFGSLREWRPPRVSLDHLGMRRYHFRDCRLCVGWGICELGGSG